MAFPGFKVRGDPSTAAYTSAQDDILKAAEKSVDMSASEKAPPCEDGTGVEAAE